MVRHDWVARLWHAALVLADDDVLADGRRHLRLRVKAGHRVNMGSLWGHYQVITEPGLSGYRVSGYRVIGVSGR